MRGRRQPHAHARPAPRGRSSHVPPAASPLVPPLDASPSQWLVTGRPHRVTVSRRNSDLELQLGVQHSVRTAQGCRAWARCPF